MYTTQDGRVVKIGFLPDADIQSEEALMALPGDPVGVAVAHFASSHPEGEVHVTVGRGTFVVDDHAQSADELYKGLEEQRWQEAKEDADFWASQRASSGLTVVVDGLEWHDVG